MASVKETAPGPRAGTLAVTQPAALLPRGPLLSRAPCPRHRLLACPDTRHTQPSLRPLTHLPPSVGQLSLLSWLCPEATTLSYPTTHGDGLLITL